jgi:hypothetical protein
MSADDAEEKPRSLDNGVIARLREEFALRFMFQLRFCFSLICWGPK